MSVTSRWSGRWGQRCRGHREAAPRAVWRAPRTAAVFTQGDCVGSFIYIFLQSGAELFNHEGKFNLFADKTVKYCNPADLLQTDPNSPAVQKSETPLPLPPTAFHL